MCLTLFSWFTLDKWIRHFARVCRRHSNYKCTTSQSCSLCNRARFTPHKSLPLHLHRCSIALSLFNCSYHLSFCACESMHTQHLFSSSSVSFLSGNMCEPLVIGARANISPEECYLVSRPSRGYLFSRPEKGQRKWYFVFLLILFTISSSTVSMCAQRSTASAWMFLCFWLIL